MIAALAGRRVDTPDAKDKRFPVHVIDKVKSKLTDVLISSNVTHLVSSAACGADLLALEVAKELNLLRTVILPFEPQLFRSISVTDRPGDWGVRYDSVIEELKGINQLIILNHDKDDPEVYRKTNISILDHAKGLGEEGNERGSTSQPSSSDLLLGLIVWEGKPKNTDDTTYHFMLEAKKRNFRVKQILTIDDSV